MGRTYATGLVIQRESLQWTTVLSDGARIEVTGRAQVALQATESEQPAPAAIPPAETDPAPTALAAAAAPPTETEAGAAAGWKDRAALLREQARSFRGALAVGLASDQLLMRVVRLPATDAAELAGMVELQFDKISPFPVDQMVFSREVLARVDSGNAVLIVGVKADVAGAVENEMNAAGATPGRIDASVMAWWQLMLDAGEIREEGRQVILIRRPAGVDLIVAQGRIPAVFRFLGQGPGVGNEEFEFEVIEEIGYTLMSLELEQGPDQRTSFTVWREDGAADTLAEKIEAARGCRAETKALSGLPPVSEGLARREVLPGVERRLDLTPASWRRASQARRLKHRMLLAAEALIGVWILGVLAVMGGSYLDGRRLAHLREQAVELCAPAQEVRDMRERLRHVNRYMDWQYSAIECLREVTGALPQTGVDLMSLTFKKGESLRVSGEASPAVELVYDLKNKLDASRLFAGNTFTRAPAAISGRPKPTFSFEIDMKFPEHAP
ncbi:MAG: hypothetical protein QME60_01920 [Verrucomicrobiota bacterium]|nr:hypothetical protein [Verrucomicrobiota bacterium]